MASIALIPARGGSQRIPRKNVRPFHGRPMISWPIASALQSGLFDHVIVSTDDAEIAEAARAAGAEVPFLRPAELSDNHTPTRPVIQHAIEALEQAGVRPDRLCCLYATAVFTTAEDLRAADDLLSKSGADFVFAAATYPHPIQRAMRLVDGGGVVMVDETARSIRSQDLEERYHDAGAFYFGTRDAFMSGATVFSERSRIVAIPRMRVHDIDTMEDWEWAEMAFKILHPHPVPVP